MQPGWKSEDLVSGQFLHQCMVVSPKNEGHKTGGSGPIRGIVNLPKVKPRGALTSANQHKQKKCTWSDS